MKSRGNWRMWPRLSAGISTTRMYTAATMPASVGVNQPVRIPPMMITGITSGSAEPRAATAISGSDARFFMTPIGPQK